MLRVNRFHWDSQEVRHPIVELTRMLFTTQPNALVRDYCHQAMLGIKGLLKGCLVASKRLVFASYSGLQFHHSFYVVDDDFLVGSTN